MLRASLQIARHSFCECLRQPVYIVLNLSAVTLIGIQPMIAMFVFSDPQKLVTDCALASIMWFGAVTAVLSGCHLFGRQDSGAAALLVLSKPIHRATYVGAKIAGLLAALAVATWTSSVASILSIRMTMSQFEVDRGVLLMYFAAVALACIIAAVRNFTHRSSFPESASITLALTMTISAVSACIIAVTDDSTAWQYRYGTVQNLAAAILLISLAVQIMGAVAASVAIRLRFVNAVLVCSGIFGVGLISDYVYLQMINLDALEVAETIRRNAVTVIVALLGLWVWAVYRTCTFGRKAFVHATFVASLLAVAACALGPSAVTATDDRGSRSQSAVVVAIDSSIRLAAAAGRAATPNWQLFWMADSVIAGRTIPASYLAAAMAYTTCAIISLAALAFLLIRSQEC